MNEHDEELDIPPMESDLAAKTLGLLSPKEVSLVLPAPDRWVKSEAGYTPEWDTSVGLVAATWTGGVVHDEGYDDDLDDIERYALALLAAVDSTRRSAVAL